MIATALVLTFVAAACFVGLAVSMMAGDKPAPARPQPVEVRATPYVPRQRTVHVDSVVTASSRQARAEQRYAQVRALPAGQGRRRVRADL